MPEGRASPTPEQLQAESNRLKQLMEEAQRIDREITEYLHRMREHGRPSLPNKRT